VEFGTEIDHKYFYTLRIGLVYKSTIIIKMQRCVP
jgi:hypothetical protein